MHQPLFDTDNYFHSETLPNPQISLCKLGFYVFVAQGKYMDIEFDYKGDPIGGVITNCKFTHS